MRSELLHTRALRRAALSVRTPLTLLLLIVAALAAVPAPVAAQTTTQVVEYYTTDAIGSVRAVTKQVNGQWQVVTRHDFMPFGEEVAPPTPPPDKRLFTGKERDSETGQDYFGARYYRADLGRFTTVDPVVAQDQALAEPQLWNRYAYARNSPLKWVDPDGRFPVLPVIVLAGIAVLATPAPANAPGPSDPTFRHDYSNGDVIANVAANLGLEFAASKVMGAAARLWTGLTGRAGELGEPVLARTAERIVGGERVGSALKADPTHRAASFLSKDELLAGRSFTIKGGDGVERTLVQTPGGMNGKKGIYEYLLDRSGKVTHQRFIEGGRITGSPNQ